MVLGDMGMVLGAADPRVVVGAWWQKGGGRRDGSPVSCGVVCGVVARWHGLQGQLCRFAVLSSNKHLNSLAWLCAKWRMSGVRDVCHAPHLACGVARGIRFVVSDEKLLLSDGCCYQMCVIRWL